MSLTKEIIQGYQPSPQCGKKTISGYYRCCYSSPPSEPGTYFYSSKGSCLCYGMGCNCCPDCLIRFSVSKNSWITIEPPSYSSLPKGWRHELTITRGVDPVANMPFSVFGVGYDAYFEFNVCPKPKPPVIPLACLKTVKDHGPTKQRRQRQWRKPGKTKLACLKTVKRKRKH